ncbi:MAG: PP2C family protein-serine/threonine phosphatase [Bacteroidetes bacterium]|nr:PP2C family protein-serine/threonine phosphatase [Bacteroidota bacterium]MBU1114478.1 PP2C family protein-serine/threonine phosphatase [Bacteroidota bacterium]MBU1796939.1 PP2C family protein-serine/threonine phosphatase [Bacteroidota bacterium]
MNNKLNRIFDSRNELPDSESIAKLFVDILEEEFKSIDFAFLLNSKVVSNSEILKSVIEKKILLSNNFQITDYSILPIPLTNFLCIIKNELHYKNEKTIQYFLSIFSLLHENIASVKENEETKGLIDSKIEQLNQLYELSKEFSGILELDYVCKLLVFSIVGQFLVSDFAILYFDKELKVLESKSDDEKIIKLVSKLKLKNITEAIFTLENFPKLFEAGFELILPMQIKNKTKGIILLGGKKNKEIYSKYDIEYINSVGSLAIISIENSILFKETLEKQAIERDLETARIIQKNLLPHNFPKSENYEIASYSESAKQVGGDYFDLLTTVNNEIVFAIGDVSGKGITASLLVANSQAYLKTINKQNLPIEEATSLLNDLVEESTVSGTFITFFWGRLNSKRELIYVNAGHNPPFLLRKGEIKKLEKGGLILGMMKTIIPYESEKIQLESGDFIITFTDGVTEAMNSAEEEYSDESLEKLCKKLKTESAEEAKEIILNDVKKFTDGFEQSDDLTMLVIKVI